MIAAIDGRLITTNEVDFIVSETVEGKPVTRRPSRRFEKIEIIPKSTPSSRPFRELRSLAPQTTGAGEARLNRPPAGWLGLGLSSRGMMSPVT